jgi:hypothetical protein
MIWLLVLTPIALVPHPASSQDLQQAKVALVQTLPDSTALASIIRTPGPNSQTTILLRERNADAPTLASAMVALFDSRRTHGEQPSFQVVINLHGHKRPESLTPNERRLGALYLARLRTADLDDVDPVGRVRTTMIALAPLRERRSP